MSKPQEPGLFMNPEKMIISNKLFNIGVMVKENPHLFSQAEIQEFLNLIAKLQNSLRCDK